MNGKIVKRCVFPLLLIGLVLMAIPLAGTTEPAVRAQVLSAAPPAKEWDAIFGGGNVLPVSKVIETSDGGYALVGSLGNYHSPSVAWLVKTNASGEMQWNQSFNYLYNVVGLVQTSDGGYILAGSYYNEEDKRLFGGSTTWGMMLVKTDPDGNVEWSRTYRGNGGAAAMTMTNDGGFALAGSVLIKTDSFGNMQWKKEYGEQGISLIHSLIQTIDGGYAWAGGKAFTENAQINRNSETFLLIRADSNGNVIWSQSYGEVPNGRYLGNNEANSLIQTEDEGFILAGNTYLYGAGGSDAWLIKTDSSGRMLWNHTYGGYGSLTYGYKANGEPFVLLSNGEGDDFANSLIKTSDGGLAFAGTTQLSIASGFSIAWLVMLDSNGNTRWNTTYSNYEQGGTGSWGANSLIETSDGGFALAGFWEFGMTTNYYYLVKTEPALPPPSPTPKPSSSPPKVVPYDLNTVLLALLMLTIIVVVVAIVALRRRKKPT